MYLLQAADLEDIAIEDYHSPGESLPSPQSFQHHQDVRSVLDSPLPANLAEFAYDHSQNNDLQATTQDFSVSSLASNLTYSTAPITEPTTFSPHPTKPQMVPTATPPAFFSPNISSSSAPMEAALLPQRPPHPSSSGQGSTLQSQMMPNSDDPLLSSSPKDSVPRRRFDFQTIKFFQSATYDQSTSTQGLAGIVLDKNGELKIIQSGTSKVSKALPINISNFGNTNGSQILKTVANSSKATYVKNGEKNCTAVVGDTKNGQEENIFATPR